jgi:pimeloyl-ACP methyl ester carboxylesterase
LRQDANFPIYNRESKEFAVLKSAFDNSGQGLTRPSWSAVAGEFWSLAAYRPRPPDVAVLARGRGEPVLVIPAFLTGDTITLPLRRFLDRCGFRSFGWELGINWGPTPGILRDLASRLEEIRDNTGSPVNVIGISLGGLLARDLAHRSPELLRHVVTVAAPVRLPTATPLEPLFHALAPFYSRAMDLDRVSTPLPVPWTAIYSKRDGILAWESCVTADGNGQCHAVEAPHIMMARNPDALRIIVGRLAPPG